MADELNPPPVTQGNATDARTTTGEIKDQQATQTVTTPDPKPDLKSTDTTTAKPDAKVEAKTEAKVDDKKTDAKPTGPPDKYDLKAPEGYEIDPKLVEEFSPIAKELGLDNAQAQKLVDVWNKHSIEAAQAGEKALTDMRDEWRDKVVKDPALGDGKGDLKPDVRANISRAIDAMGDTKAIAAFKEQLDLTGVGDNPAFVAGLNALGKRLGEGTLVRGANPSPGGQTAPGKISTPAQALYPNLPSSAS